jgi:hypothetical protein
MWFMPRAAREGRGGDSGWAFTDRVKSRMLKTCSPEEIKERVARRLQDPDVAAWPNLVHVLHYPKKFAAALRPGHRLVAELSNDEPLTGAHNALLPPDAFHLPVGRPVTHKIYRDASHPSRLVLPFTRRSAVGGTAGA